MEKREDWAPAFSKIGIDKDKMMAMSETEFINCKDYLIMEGFKPGPIPELSQEKMEQLILMSIKKNNQIQKK